MAERDFHLKVLGRTLEHLGAQMYKRRDTAIAELVANSWDAGATFVDITVPEAAGYARETSEIKIADDGIGMVPDEIDDDYLVVGRNRREDGQPAAPGRPVMGRKGIGKLAGFGIASKLRLETTKDGVRSALVLDADALRRDPGEVADIAIPGDISEATRETHGTTLTLTSLKHSTPIDEAALRLALARRFSRSVIGSMEIRVNGDPVGEPVLELETRVPADGSIEHTLDDGGVVRYWYGFAEKPIRDTILRGFTVLVRGKTAQAPPYFFDVEGTASGQHGTRYMTGVIEADYLDEGTDSEGDLISTDRQEIDWENELSHPLKQWGDALTRQALRDWANRREEKTTEWVNEDEELSRRIARLDGRSQEQVTKVIRILGHTDADKERVLQLSSAVVAAFEYRHFHDLTEEIEAASADPEQLERLLAHLSEWGVLESRAILEIIKGRLAIVEKFGRMVAEDAPETAPRIGVENLHDLIASYPWLIDPDWQVLAEEKAITTQLREWEIEEVGPYDQGRYDFLALSAPDRLQVIELKRPGIEVSLAEVQRLERYEVALDRGRAGVQMVLISSGRYEFDQQKFEDRAVLLTWREVHERTRRYYEHYRAILEGDVGSADFARKTEEVARTRGVLATGAYRGREARAAGLGAQDVVIPTPDAGSTPEEGGV